METSIGSKDSGKMLLQPSTSKDLPGVETPKGEASVFCQELLYNHALVINGSTIEKDLDNYTKRIYPSQHIKARTVKRNAT